MPRAHLNLNAQRNFHISVSLAVTLLIGVVWSCSCVVQEHRFEWSNRKVVGYQVT